jgi:transposase
MKRKTHNSAFKFRVAMAAAKSDKTISAICQQFEVAPSLVHKWKKELLENGTDIFDGVKKASKAKKSDQDKDKKISKLYEKVGRLTVDRDFLKKNGNNIRRKTNKDARRSGVIPKHSAAVFSAGRQ